MSGSRERYIDGDPPLNWELFYQHMGRYLFARQYVSEKVVLDAACGTGYGTAMLAKKARNVVGVDNSRDAILHGIKNYQKTNVHFMQMDCCQISFKDNSFDVVISFETLEHITNMNLFLKELQRVLKPGGVLLVSTPNRPLYAVYNKGRANIYHCLELDENEFRQLLSKYFAIEKIWGQRHFSKKDIPLVHLYAAQGVPTGPDNFFRRAARVILRSCFPTWLRSRNFLMPQIWANKCWVGEIAPSSGVYMIAKAIKT